MPQTKLGSKRNAEALDYAKDNGFEVSFTKKGHVRFMGHGGTVIASGTPSRPENVKKVIGQMRRLIVLEAATKED